MAAMNHMGGGQHICMWEGPSYTPSALEIDNEALKAQRDSSAQELQRLRNLLDANNISWTKPKVENASSSFKSRRASRSSIHHQTTLVPWTRSAAAKQKLLRKPLPHLPNEILLRILKAAVTHPHPIIDPFWKMLPENMTDHEQSRSAKCLNLGMLSTCKAFRQEGINMFITNNRFIFTQVGALQNFSNFSPEARASIEHVTLRLIAKYFDDTAYKKILRGNSIYHADLESPVVWVKARPTISTPDRGMQSYSWQQLMDFLQCLVLRRDSGSKHPLPLLFSNLKTMRLDLVNFSEHIPFLGSQFFSILRWHVGKLLDELIVTGLVEEDMSNGENRFLHHLVRDNGIFGSGVPVFASARADRLKTLRGYELDLQLVTPPAHATVSDSPVPVVTHPEGGSPPESIFGEGLTTWKYISTSLADPTKKWIEFHTRCGLPVENCGELQAMIDDIMQDVGVGDSSESDNSDDSMSDDGLGFEDHLGLD